VVIDRPEFGLVVSQTGNPAIWAPYCAESGSLAAFAGRPVFDESDWLAARLDSGAGGWAAKIATRRLDEEGEPSVERLNGNSALVALDGTRHILYLVTDCCGVFPSFHADTAEGPVYGSHPDVVAQEAGENRRFDDISLAEFILSGTVTPPNTFYERVRALDSATVLRFDLRNARIAPPSRRRYFTFEYRGDNGTTEQELANNLAGALIGAVRRRTNPLLGPVAVALSGGLDSRIVLGCSANPDHTIAFNCFDRPNRELRAAGTIAKSLATRFLPVQRDEDYYGVHAECGVRISGGMGSLANNHFLGAIPRLKAEGIETMLTGCYCDYLFKALPLNKRSHWLTRRESLGSFRHQFYFDHFGADTVLAARARERMGARVPADLQKRNDPAAVFQIEALRTFPLCYEGDNQQRLVPQRTMGWCPPFVDRDVIDVYCRLPYTLKFNRSMFRKTVTAISPRLGEITDANTGASPGSSAAWEWVRSTQLRLGRAAKRLAGVPVNEESWPEWKVYLEHSHTLADQWKRPNPIAADLYHRVLGRWSDNDFETAKRQQPFLFLGLLTVKLWLDQRAA